MAMQRFPVNEFPVPPWATPSNPNAMLQATAIGTPAAAGAPRASSSTGLPPGMTWSGSPRMSTNGNSSGSWVPSADPASLELGIGINRINDLFGDRASIYDQLRGDLYGLQSSRLNEDRADTLRKLRFGLARTGLAGGSADIDARGMEQRTYGRSLMDASNKAQSLADEVRANDERARLNLIAQMRAGLDSGNATQSAFEQMRGNLDAARGANSYAAVDAYAQAMQPALAQFQIQQGIQQARRNYVPYRLAPGSSGTLISE